MSNMTCFTLYVTVNHSGQNHTSDNKTTAIAFQFISVIWHLITYRRKFHTDDVRILEIMATDEKPNLRVNSYI